MNANNRLLFVMDKHCAFCTVMNEVLIVIYVNLTMCVLCITSAAPSVVSVNNDPSEQHAQKSPVGGLTKHVNFHFVKLQWSSSP